MTQEKIETRNIFQRPFWVVVFALTAAIAWGWAYPLIKMGIITSCLCLGETFYWKYVLAGALATIGIYIINKGK